MEMMHILRGVPSGSGPAPGIMASGPGGGIFGDLLNQQQAATAGEKTAEAGDPGLLAAWLVPVMPTAVPGWPLADAAGEGLSEGSMPLLPAGRAAGFSGFAQAPDTTVAGERQSPFEAPGFVNQQNAADLIPVAAAETAEAELAAPKNHVQPQFGMSPSGRPAASVPARGVLPEPALSPENRGRAAAQATAPVGVLEHRFAELLGPVAATVSGAELRAGQPVQSLPLMDGGQTPGCGEPAATPAVAVDTSAPGEFPRSGEMTMTDGPLTEPPGLMANGDFSALRTPASVSQPTTADTSALKQPFAGSGSESRILDQVVGRMAIERNQDVSRMSIKLQPEELGRIEIDLTVEQGRLKAQMVAQTQQVQEVLERHLPRLREALEQHGLKLDQIQVSVDAQAGDGRGFSHQHRQAEHHPRPWSGSQQPSPVGEKEEITSPAVSPPGRVSLRI